MNSLAALLLSVSVFGGGDALQLATDWVIRNSLREPGVKPSHIERDDLQKTTEVFFGHLSVEVLDEIGVGKVRDYQRDIERSLRTEVRVSKAISSAEQVELKLRAMLTRFGVPEEWPTLHVMFKEDQPMSLPDTSLHGIARLGVAERFMGLPLFGYTNSASIEVDPASGHMLGFWISKQAKPVEGPFVLTPEQAAAIANQVYRAERHLIPESLDNPVPHEVQKGYGTDQKHGKIPQGVRKDLPAVPAYRVSYEGETNPYVVVDAGSGAVLWRSWRLITPKHPDGDWRARLGLIPDSRVQMGYVQGTDGGWSRARFWVDST